MADYSILQHPETAERCITKSPQDYEGWTLLGTSKKEPGDFEEWDGKQFKLDAAQKAGRDQERIARDPLAMLARIEALEARISQLEKTP